MIMAKTLLRDKARLMRIKGASLQEIVLRFNVPKSTVRYWCRNIVLAAAQQKNIFNKQKLGGILSGEKLRLKRIKSTKQLRAEGIQEIGRLSHREILLVGSALYWAEGYNKGDNEFGFTNSNPLMIRLMVKWLIDVCKIPKKDIYFRVCINVSHKNRIGAVTNYWAQTLHFPLSQFSNPTFINSNSKKVYLNREKYFGTLRVKVHKSTILRRKIMGWISGLAKSCI